MSFLKSIMAVALLSIVSVLPSSAQQQMNAKSLSKATWHESPREIQILDERPVIRDFREAPSAPQNVQLPPGPQGFDPNGGGGGNGALGGGAPTLPAGGLQLGNGKDPGYRTPAGGLGSLPKSGFGGPSNIPARGMAPRGALPGVTQGVVGNIMAKKPAVAAAAGPAGGMGAHPMARTAGNTAAAPKVASYGGYGQGAGNGVGSSSSTETSLRGTLLRH
ncbi:MAG: hypothetical protein P4L53_11855 [Candidatus Obscuribacterales bacterium]|nr:hypothetical protein [Candidatus Obscuribacterales bacterium]